VAANSPLRQAVEAAIVVSAHVMAREQVFDAAQSMKRLGALTSGRWRAAARDLDRLGEELMTAGTDIAYDLQQRAASLGIEVESLWMAGDAAGTLDMLREEAADHLDEDSSARRLLDESEALFGVSFVEEDVMPDRGRTLVFGWAAPLEPAVWPWQATWVVGDGEEDDAEEELELFEAEEATLPDTLWDDIARDLQIDRVEAREALMAVAEALTRASLLASGQADEDDEDEDQVGLNNGSP
jgi:hypothetical protein